MMSVFLFNEFYTMAWNSLSSLTTIKQTGQETQGRQPLLRAVSLDHWLIVYTKGNYETALTLQQNLQRVTPRMGITVRNAKL